MVLPNFASSMAEAVVHDIARMQIAAACDTRRENEKRMFIDAIFLPDAVDQKFLFFDIFSSRIFRRKDVHAERIGDD